MWSFQTNFAEVSHQAPSKTLQPSRRRSVLPQANPSKEKAAMCDFCKKLAITVLGVVGSAIFASSQTSSGVLPPLPTGAKSTTVQLVNAPTKPGPQTGSGARWTKLNNAPPVSLGAMLLLTDGPILAHEEPNCNIGPNCGGIDFTALLVFES